MKTMTEKISFKNVLMILMALLLSVSTTSCLGDDDDDDEDQRIQESAASTGLCGCTWVLKSIIDGETTDTDVQHDVYIFDETGEGTHEYTDEAGAVCTINFTWKSYLYNVNLHELVIRLEGDSLDQYTYYAIDTENGCLRLMALNSSGYTVIHEYEAQ